MLKEIQLVLHLLNSKLDGIQQNPNLCYLKNIIEKVRDLWVSSSWEDNAISCPGTALHKLKEWDK